MKSDSYQVVRVTKIKGDRWEIVSRTNYEGKEIEFPIPVIIKWAGDTAVMTLDEITTAGGKKYSARVMFHNDLDRSIAELAALMRPTLTVVDASRVLMETGPKGGSLSAVKQVGAVAVGVDPVALDAWAYSLWGVGPNELPPLFELAEGMGLGRAALYTDAPVEVVTG